MSAAPLPTASSGNAPLAIDKRVSDVIDMLFEPKYMEEELKTHGLDLDRKPLSAYTKTDVINAKELLRDMELWRNKIVMDRELEKSPMSTWQKNEVKEKIKNGLNWLKKQAATFFQSISLATSFEKQSVSKKDHNKLEILKWNFKRTFLMLSILDDLIDVYHKSQQPRHTLLPKFKVKMTALEKNSSDFRMIADFMMKGMCRNSRAELIDIMKFEIPKKPIRGGRKMKSKLLWLGLPRPKVFHVLKTGKIPIPGNTSNQSNFFGGLPIFNDMFAGALANTKAMKGTVTLLLLAEVTMGKAWTVTREDPNVEDIMKLKQCEIVIGEGSEYPDEDGDVIHPEGFTVPAGEKKFRFEGSAFVDSHTFTNNQYGISNPDRVDLKYGVVCRLHDSSWV